MRTLLVVLLALFVLSACGGSSSASVAGTWKLVSYGSPSNQIPAVADVDAFIEFTDQKVTGNVGCNSFGGEYKVDRKTITFTNVASTLMFCGDPVGEQETATLKVLGESANFALSGSALTLTSGDGASMIVLEQK